MFLREEVIKGLNNGCSEFLLCLVRIGRRMQVEPCLCGNILIWSVSWSSVGVNWNWSEWFICHSPSWTYIVGTWSLDGLFLSELMSCVSWRPDNSMHSEAADWQLLHLHLGGENCEYLAPASKVSHIWMGFLTFLLGLSSHISAVGPWVWIIPWSATLRNPPSIGSPSTRCWRSTCRNKQRNRKVTPDHEFPAYVEGPG